MVALADDSELRWNCMMFTTGSVDIRTRALQKEKHGFRGRRTGMASNIGMRMTVSGDAVGKPTACSGYPRETTPFGDIGSPGQMIWNRKSTFDWTLLLYILFFLLLLPLFLLPFCPLSKHLLSISFLFFLYFFYISLSSFTYFNNFL